MANFDLIPNTIPYGCTNNKKIHQEIYIQIKIYSNSTQKYPLHFSKIFSNLMELYCAKICLFFISFSNYTFYAAFPLYILVSAFDET